MRYVSEKSTSNHENGKQLQVTIIKITESKENKSIHRLDLPGSTGPGGQLPPCSPASYGSVYLLTEDLNSTKKDAFSKSRKRRLLSQA